MGEDGTVRGRVQDYLYKHTGTGKSYILLFDKPGTVHAGGIDLLIPKSFKVVIWKDDHKNFPENFAAAYSGHTVCATGRTWIAWAIRRLRPTIPANLRLIASWAER